MDGTALAGDLDALRRRHRGNSLFRPFLLLPDGWVAVYHFTSEGALDPIAEEGLRPRTLEVMSPARQRMERIVAAAAPPGLSHVASIFGYPALWRECVRHQAKLLRLGISRATVALEVAIDPARAIVADTLTWNDAAWWLHFRDAEEQATALAARYWQRRLPLTDYLALDRRAQARRARMPEVLVPADPASHLHPRYLRVCGVLVPDAVAAPGPRATPSSRRSSASGGS